MIEFTVGALSGIAAHQTDRFVRQFPADWREITRYTIGTLTMLVVFMLTLGRLNRSAVRDGLLAYLVSAIGVGVGVAGARLLDVMEIRK